MITLSQLRKYTSRNELIAALNKGSITEKDLRGVYSAFRKQINAQAARIDKSDIPFLPGSNPSMRKLKNIITTRDLVSEIADGLRFYHSKSYSRKGRVAQRQAAIKALNAHGINISVDNWGKWREFMEWFKHTEYSVLYDSDSEITMDVFNGGATVEQWERIFADFARR